MVINYLNHVAVIPDGNRRWAKEHRLPALKGHRRGAEAMHNVIDYLIEQVKYLTIWGFSGDNWRRSNNEVEGLFRLLEQWIYIDTDWLDNRNVKLQYIGRISELPDFLQLAINQAGKLTQNNTGMTLTLAFNYGGRAEILDAVNRLVRSGLPPQIDESLFSRYLYTDGMPDVDLVIRTAGEVRLSNFLLWQTAYSEFYFTEVLWPDFGAKELEKALQAYSERRRRFGGD